MKQYRVARSIYGDLGSLRRNAVLLDSDERIRNNPKAVKDLLQKKLLVEEAAAPPSVKAKAKTK